MSSRNGAGSEVDSVSRQSGISGPLPSQPSLLSRGQRVRAGGKIPAEGF